MLAKNISSFSWLIILTWLAYFSYFDLWYLFKHNYFISITMAFGSFIAGATSEGGGAVAFPVMTLIYKITPDVARDYSLLIQSFGMTAASFAIMKKKIKVEKITILFTSLGAVVGNILGFVYIQHLFYPAGLKIFFCSLWLAFAFTLIKVKVFKTDSLTEDRVPQKNSFIILLTFLGLIGGILSSLMGSGLDILVFSLLTLFFSIQQKIAVPTSVIIMAINSIACVLLKTIFLDGLSPEAIAYAQVSIPIVVIGAPLGSLFIHKRTDLFITLFLVFSIVVQFITALCILPLTVNLIVLSLSTIIFSIFLFTLFVYLGKRSAQIFL